MTPRASHACSMQKSSMFGKAISKYGQSYTNITLLASTIWFSYIGSIYIVDSTQLSRRFLMVGSTAIIALNVIMIALHFVVYQDVYADAVCKLCESTRRAVRKIGLVPTILVALLGAVFGVVLYVWVMTRWMITTIKILCRSHKR